MQRTSTRDSVGYDTNSLGYVRTGKDNVPVTKRRPVHSLSSRSLR